jgi:hypothetical protein
MVNGKWKKKIRSSIQHLPFTIYWNVNYETKL